MTKKFYNVDNRSSVNHTTDDFPEPEDYNGAVKGLVMLYDTYLLDLKAAADGKVSYLSSQYLPMEFQGREKLQVEDLYELASKATSQLLFDTGVGITREAFALAEKVKPVSSTMKKLTRLRKNLVHLVSML